MWRTAAVRLVGRSESGDRLLDGTGAVIDRPTLGDVLGPGRRRGGEHILAARNRPWIARPPAASTVQFREGSALTS